MTLVDTKEASREVKLSTVKARDFGLAILGGFLLTTLVALDEYLVLPQWVELLFQAVRIPLGVPFVLYLPGYFLTAAFFPERPLSGSGEAIDIDGIERTALSIGLSAAWIAVLALILDRLPWGLRLWPILLGELGSILLFMSVAIWRRSRLPDQAVYQPGLLNLSATWQALPIVERRLYALITGLVFLAGLTTAWILLNPSPGQFMTEFYVLGEEKLVEGYPYSAQVAEQLSATIGIINLERETKKYRVELWAIDPWQERRELVQTAGLYTLEREETVEERLTWAMPWAGQDQIVEFHLFTGEQQPGDEPYRQLRLWLNVNKTTP